MEHETLTERIDRYLDDVLDPTEKAAFENEMTSDTELRLEVGAQEAMRGLIRSKAEKEDLQKLFDAFHTELNAGIPGDTRKRDNENEAGRKKGIIRKVQWRQWSYGAVAASVAIVLIGVWAVLKDRKLTGNQTEIRVDNRQEAFRIPLLSWKTVDFKPVVQDRRMVDAAIIRHKDYHFHYRFTSILEIYSDKLTGKQQKISIAYDVGTKQYRLHIGSRSYPIRKTEEITPLSPN